jgi:hypothetical protein
MTTWAVPPHRCHLDHTLTLLPLPPPPSPPPPPPTTRPGRGDRLVAVLLPPAGRAGLLRGGGHRGAGCGGGVDRHAHAPPARAAGRAGQVRGGREGGTPGWRRCAGRRLLCVPLRGLPCNLGRGRRGGGARVGTSSRQQGAWCSVHASMHAADVRVPPQNPNPAPPCPSCLAPRPASARVARCAWWGRGTWRARPACLAAAAPWCPRGRARPPRCTAAGPWPS